MATEKDNALDINRPISVHLLRNSGLLTVDVPKGQKNPKKGWEPRNNDLDVSARLLDKIEFLDSNIGAHLTPEFIDVDVDTDNTFMFMALDAFLPDCSHVWGRASKRRSHRLYRVEGEEFDPSAFPILNKVKRISAINVELRGGSKSRGEYSLLPGSVHPSGELYEWHNIGSARSAVTTTSVRAVVSAYRKAAAAALLAPYFVEGLRQELTMAVAGFCHRVLTMQKDMYGDQLESQFHMDLEECMDFINVLLDISNDDPSDSVMRRKAFRATWMKAEDDTPVTGGKRIAELTGDDHILNYLYLLFTDNPSIAKMDEYLNRFAILEGPGSVIDMDRANSSSAPTQMTRQGFTNSFGVDKMVVGGKPVLMSNLLFSLAQAIKVQGFTMAPSEPLLVDDENGGKLVNQWCGFRLEPNEEKVQEEEIKWFLDYVKDILCDGDNRLYQWVMSWLADLFQDPANKPGTALVLVALPGAGKSFLGENIIRPIIGDRHSFQTNDLERVTAKHNVITAGKLFVQCDEATNSRQKAQTARVKALVTDKKQVIEPKGFESYELPSFMRFLLTSNELEDAIHLPDLSHDRRFTVLRVSDKMVAKESEFWEPFALWLTDENLSKILRYLLDFEYSKSLIRRAFMTKAKAVMIAGSFDDVQTGIVKLVEQGWPTGNKRGHEEFEFLDIDQCFTQDISQARYVRVDILTDAMRNGMSRGKGDHQIWSQAKNTGLFGKKVIKKEYTVVDMQTGDKKRTKGTFWSFATEDSMVDYVREVLGAEINPPEEADTEENLDQNDKRSY